MQIAYLLSEMALRIGMSLFELIMIVNINRFPSSSASLLHINKLLKQFRSILRILNNNIVVEICINEKRGKLCMI